MGHPPADENLNSHADFKEYRQSFLRITDNLPLEAQSVSYSKSPGISSL